MKTTGIDGGAPCDATFDGIGEATGERPGGGPVRLRELLALVIARWARTSGASPEADGLPPLGILLPTPLSVRAGDAPAPVGRLPPT